MSGIELRNFLRRQYQLLDLSTKYLATYYTDGVKVAWYEGPFYYNILMTHPIFIRLQVNVLCLYENEEGFRYQGMQVITNIKTGLTILDVRFEVNGVDIMVMNICHRPTTAYNARKFHSKFTSHKAKIILLDAIERPYSYY